MVAVKSYAVFAFGDTRIGETVSARNDALTISFFSAISHGAARRVTGRTGR
jgi:hypothetical protein